jgi:hypothetical protein
MVAAALNPHAAREQPILRLLDTVLGIAVGLAGSYVSSQLMR